ncbi:GNAT family N-acetyltransferase [Algoriphagus halophytocola]|uniref:GNAT family N-acetyltransferase n=1 Tax=Algoriphagus halophytocola TaxID=2991499 RepID=A0ABY6MKZ2_9BACT|nr:GNAT family N-acetyltransferase [Algoriphagus sp. TR-M5]UZD24437.1 GNAT family N-acetyltransferase [Algoriphagus sp. TR-M5]
MRIRKAQIIDSEVIATLLMQATGDVIYKFIGDQDFDKAKRFLLHFVAAEYNQYSFQNCYVLVQGARVLAAALVYDGACLNELRKPVLDYIHCHFDAELEVEEETQAGEIYLDSLAVDPAHQGKGLGAELLRFLIDEFVHKGGKKLGLLVDQTNPDAKRLYLRLGFRVVEEKMLLGITLDHLQLG